MPMMFCRVVRVGLAENMGLGQRCEWVGAGMGSWQSWGIAFQVERASLQRGGPIWGRGGAARRLRREGVALGKPSSCATLGSVGGLSGKDLTFSEGRSRRVVRVGGAPRMDTYTGSGDSAFCCLWCGLACTVQGPQTRGC